jgi:RimJ/RimL family protein N-acetyltransferase
MPELIQFETDRLKLRQWKSSDRDPFAALNGDPKVMEFFPATLDRASSDAIFDRLQSDISDRGWGFWAAEIKETNQFIGFVGLNIPTYDLPHFNRYSPCVEIGWRLAVPYWGKGLATEAAMGALQVGFHRLGLTEIISFTTIKNIRSRAVMERIGMEETETIFQHPLVPVDSNLGKHCLYLLSRDRWEQFSRSDR